MLKVEQWSQKEAQAEIPKRLKQALEYRKQFEQGWAENHRMLFSNSTFMSTDAVTYSYDTVAELFAGDLSSGDSEISINYCFKYLRYIHSIASANPPSVIPRPTSSDYQDRRAAEVAADLVDWLRRHYDAQNRTDLTILQTFAYGTGFARTMYDWTKGEVDSVQGNNITMTGDLNLYPCLIEDIAIDPAARCWEDVRYVFERHVMSTEEFKSRFPEHADKAADDTTKRSGWWDKDGDDAQARSRISVWEYTERALPWNGMRGRRVFLLGPEDGTLLTPLDVNPNPDAVLGYHVLTDVDVPGQVYGRTFVDYIRRLQDVLNRLDSQVLDNIQAHGNVRMVVFDAAEGEDDQISNSGWEIVNIRGSAAQKPQFVNPPQLMPDLHRFRQQLVEGMEQLAGVNEAMFGQMSREMSGFSMQTAINAGNMTRRRFFNKYEKFVESVYQDLLALIKAYWTDQRKILVTGKEGALSVAHYSGADIRSGFDLDVEYGTSFSLDPASRREEILQLMPFLKEAGFGMKQILSMLKLNDISGLFDMAEAAKRRQMEIFDEIIAKYEETGVLVAHPPEELEEHEAMLAAAYEFRMSMAFKVLDRPVKDVIEEHIKTREKLAAKAQVPAAGGAGGPGAGGGLGAALGGLPGAGAPAGGGAPAPPGPGGPAGPAGL